MPRIVVRGAFSPKISYHQEIFPEPKAVVPVADIFCPSMQIYIHFLLFIGCLSVFLSRSNVNVIELKHPLPASWGRAKSIRAHAYNEVPLHLGPP